MANRLDATLAYLRERRPDFLAALVEYSAFPSVSTDPERAADVQACAEWVAERLRALNVQNVTISPTDRHPIVYGESLEAGPGAPVVLVYGHYDVQPPDPLDLWHSPPFQAEVRGDFLYGRGVADMKSQLLAGLAAIEALRHSGPLPVNLKFMIEGEEEIGSPNLAAWMEANRDRLACDFALNLDGGMEQENLPTIIYGIRGLAAFEVTVTGPDHDLHSGVFGGVVANPVQVLCKLVGDMRDAEGRITLPGFYDSVRTLSEAERAELNRHPVGPEAIRAEAGVPELWGERGYTMVEQNTIRPSLDVNGITGGFGGAGIKTIIPSSATAKISMRLAPDQTPQEVFASLKRYMEERAPSTVRWEVKMLGGAFPVVSDCETPYMRALAEVMEEQWGVPPLFVRMGATVPVLAMFQQILGVEPVSTGFAIPGNLVHSPNENQHLPSWYHGMEALARYFLKLGQA